MKTNNCIIAGLLLLTTSLWAETIHVPNDQPTIQTGLDTAVEGDTVLVASGTYYENIIWPEVNGIKLIGSGQEDCIIDGDSLGSVIRFDEGLGGIVDETTLVIGFTIRNGYAQGSYPDYYGGGIYCRDSSPTIADARIEDNSANYGGGIHCYYSSPILTNVTISGNSATNYGGGMCCVESSSPTLSNVTLVNNMSSSGGGGISCRVNCSPSLSDVAITSNSSFEGGGMHCYYSSPSLTTVMIIDNSADFGGGIHLFSSSPTLSDVMITTNSAIENGGGMCCVESSSPTLSNVTINDNSAIGAGGGIYCSSSNPSMVSVTISGNFVYYYGGGIYCVTDSHPTLTNVTITDNSAIFIDGTGDGIYCSSSHPNLENCILWNNPPQEVVFRSEGGYSSITATCSDIEGGEAGIETNGNGEIYWLENNIDTDPLFCDPENYDYRLQITSPCRTVICGFMGYTGETCESEGVDDVIAEPEELFLSQNCPNPFNPMTRIQYNLPQSQKVALRVYDLAGRMTVILVDDYEQAGTHEVVFDGHGLASGVYVYQLQSAGSMINRKMVFIK